MYDFPDYTATLAVDVDRETADLWARFTQASDAGLVRVRAVYDDNHDPHDSYATGDDAEDARLVAREREIIARDGVWGTVAERACPYCGAWVNVSDVWGHVGYANPLDPRENPYVCDLMALALQELADNSR